jgi:hypothetical protein
VLHQHNTAQLLLPIDRQTPRWVHSSSNLPLTAQTQPRIAWASSLALAFSGSSQLSHEPSLLILSERSRDLAHHHPWRIARISQVVAVGCENADAAIDEQEDAELLRHQIASKAWSVFDNNGANAIAFNARE